MVAFCTPYTPSMFARVGSKPPLPAKTDVHYIDDVITFLRHSETKSALQSGHLDPDEYPHDMAAAIEAAKDLPPDRFEMGSTSPPPNDADDSRQVSSKTKLKLLPLCFFIFINYICTPVEYTYINTMDHYPTGIHQCA